MRFLNDGTLFDKGTIVQTGTGNLGLHSDSVVPTTLNIEIGGSYLIESDSGIDNNSGGTSAVTNAGTIEKTAGSGVSTILVNGTLSNTGAIAAESGTIAMVLTGSSPSLAQLPATTLTAGTWDAVNGAALDFPNGSNIVTNQGSIALGGAGASIPAIANLNGNSGGFTVTAGATFSTTSNFDNSGTLTLGPAGTVTVNGTYTQESTGAFAVQVGGSSGSGNFGRISVAGPASLDGTLGISLANGFQPSPGDTYDVMDYASHSGDFSIITGLGSLFTESTNAGNVLLKTISGGGGGTSDLAVQDVNVPLTALAGQNVTITADITNNGPGTALNDWFDSFFLAVDGALDAASIRLGQVHHKGDLAPGASYTDSLTVPFPGLVPGSAYQVVVETDSRLQTSDSNLANNVLLSTAVTLGVAKLALDTPTAATVQPGGTAYFEVDVSPGATVQVSTQSSAPGAVGLFLRASSSPGRQPIHSTPRPPTRASRFSRPPRSAASRRPFSSASPEPHQRAGQFHSPFWPTCRRSA